MRALLLTLLLTLLAGCSTFRADPAPPSGSWDEYQLRALALQNWTLDSKVGIRTADDSQSARMQWQQQTPDYRISISGPLGQGGALIEGNDQGVSIDIAGEGRYASDSPEALLQSLLGWSFPVEQVRFWIRGLPAPGLPFAPTFSENRLQTLEQGGWLIHYSAYSKDLGQVLPQRITLKRADLTITVIIKEWIAS
ncbi:lipoprotein insertase outer membrane protein LolB [Marinobacterium rhizophilum]|uniref:Outer-membrane lipoprotein LolB n=1 Tax=Marinobacterium rhizophilum TaxID=420402 RepID=A0ABY5HJN7_9GAMM|nr:lipoprotein insertase outer membrane protein LolB [Marinobacterium rhizophilum]UTW11477.1 outer membrane lipoprotein LolB [Marinobacterium rhizophilum]